ncbi:MAG: ribonuclease HII [bacterium]
MFFYENKLYAQGKNLIAGLDEAGRGPLAGPVVAGAVILPECCDIQGLNDSKKLSPKKRDSLFNQIYDVALGVGIGIADTEEVDKINILAATHRAMNRAVDNLNVSPEYILVDGLRVPSLKKPQIAIVKGDSKSASIAAASIIAKVTRDRIMIDYAKQYPQYGFEKHKGYATQFHLEAIAKFGISSIHRRSFSPVLEKENKQKGKISLGEYGEDFTCRFLKTKRYKIIEKNYRSLWGEIDIIAKDKDTLVFIEVKTRSSDRFGPPESSVTRTKQNRIRRIAEAYIKTSKYQNLCFRFDVVSILFDSKKNMVDFKLIQNAF